jgi:hypothetical protein
MNIYTKTFTLALLFSSVWLSGCSQNISVRSSWQDNVSHNQSFKRILIVGVSPDANVRCDFEHFLATQVSSATVVATPSCNTMPINDPLTLESIDAAVIAEQSDAVLATILVASKIGAKEGGSNDTRGLAQYKAVGTGYGSSYYYGGYGRYGVPVTYVEFKTAAPVTTIEGEVDIVSRLFETGGGTLVYEVTLNASDLYSRESAFAMITAPVAERLRRDGVIE